MQNSYSKTKSLFGSCTQFTWKYSCLYLQSDVEKNAKQLSQETQAIQIQEPSLPNNSELPSLSLQRSKQAKKKKKNCINQKNREKVS